LTRLALLALLLAPAWGQMSIIAVRQNPGVVAQYIKLPKDLSVYRVDACAETADAVSADWVIHQLSGKLAIQDGAFAQHAAEIFKANGLWPRVGAAVGKVAPKAMGVAAGFLTANPYAGVGVTFAIEHIVESGARRGTLEVPANWYRASQETARPVQLGPRGCLPAMLVAVDGKAEGIVTLASKGQASDSKAQPAAVRMFEQGAEESFEDADINTRPAMIAAMVRARTAAGSVE
jgi:hypothetical protein